MQDLQDSRPHLVNPVHPVILSYNTPPPPAPPHLFAARVDAREPEVLADEARAVERQTLLRCQVLRVGDAVAVAVAEVLQPEVNCKSNDAGG